MSLNCKVRLKKLIFLNHNREQYRRLVEEPDSRLYFALGNGDIVALSPQTLRSRIIRSTGEGLVGLAFDRTENLIYWSTLSKISRAVASDSGSNVEIVLGTTRGNLPLH